MEGYKISHVAKLTGLSSHVIRSWERRFDLLKPERGKNRYRRYTQEDVDLLCYLREQVENGFSISQLAERGRKKLLSQTRKRKDRPGASGDYSLHRLHQALVSSLMPLDRARFIQHLNQGVSLLPFDEVFFKLLVPLQRRVGDLWHAGKIGVAVEHFVTQKICEKMLSVLNQISYSQQGPKVVITCLPNEHHELGAWMAAYQCAMMGCRVFYLGANLPVHELGKFCVEIRPDLVLLSGTVTPPEPEARALAQDYARWVLPVCFIWAGGPAMESMGAHFSEYGIEVVDSLQVLEHRLKSLSKI